MNRRTQEKAIEDAQTYLSQVQTPDLPGPAKVLAMNAQANLANLKAYLKGWHDANEEGSE